MAAIWLGLGYQLRDSSKLIDFIWYKISSLFRDPSLEYVTPSYKKKLIVLM